MIQKAWHHLRTDSLFRNSAFLIASTGVMSVLGFIFWLLVARFYTSEQIGLAASFIAVTVLLSNLAMFGLDTVLIRYVPGSKRPNTFITTSLVSVVLATLVAATIYLLGIQVFSPGLLFIVSSPWTIAGFLFLMVILSVNTLTDSVFIAYRAAQFNLGISTAFSLVKVLLPLLLVGLGMTGLILAYGGAVAVAVVLSLACMVWRFGYRLEWRPMPGMMRKMASFSVLNHMAELLAGLPSMLMPILIVNRLGASEAAYYYFAAMISGLLLIVPSAIASSQLAEGAHNPKAIRKGAVRAAGLSMLILLPAVLFIDLLAHRLLLVFGKEYALGGEEALKLLVAVSIPAALNAIVSTILKLQHRMWRLTIVNAVLAAVSIGIALFMTTVSGLIIAMIIGQVVALVGFAIALALGGKPQHATDDTDPKEQIIAEGTQGLVLDVLDKEQPQKQRIKRPQKSKRQAK